MSVMTRSIIIQAPVEEVFEFAKDPGRFVAAIPDFATRAAVLTRDGAGSSTQAYSHGLGIHFEGTVEYTEVVANQRIVAKVSFPGEHPTWTFTFEPLDSGTKLTMRAEWHVKAPVVGTVMDTIKAREHGSMAEQWLEAVRIRVEPAAVRWGDASAEMTSEVKDSRTEAPGSTGPLRAALRRGLLHGAWAWAGVPSGPLGWFSTRTVFPLTSGTLYQAMAEALDLQPDDELLDVGCGSGAFLAQHASHARRVAGIDLSDIQIELAHRHLRDRLASGTADIVKGDATVLPWPDNSFTAATCMSAFEVFPDPAKVLAEVFRVLRPGGRAVLTMGERVRPNRQTDRRWGRLWVWAEDDARRMVEQAGFTDVTIRYARAWGSDPVSKSLIKIWEGFGVDMREGRIVSAVKK